MNRWQYPWQPCIHYLPGLALIGYCMSLPWFHWHSLSMHDLELLILTISNRRYSDSQERLEHKDHVYKPLRFTWLCGQINDRWFWPTSSLEHLCNGQKGENQTQIWPLVWGQHLCWFCSKNSSHFPQCKEQHFFFLAFFNFVVLKFKSRYINLATGCAVLLIISKNIAKFKISGLPF